MYYNITDVYVVTRDSLAVTFADGTAGNVRFAPEFFTGVFAPLRDAALFARATLEDGALSWPCDVDIAPDALYSDIVAQGEAVLR